LNGSRVDWGGSLLFSLTGTRFSLAEATALQYAFLCSSEVC
jgi:hypothetical protein